MLKILAHIAMERKKWITLSTEFNISGDRSSKFLVIVLLIRNMVAKVLQKSSSATKTRGWPGTESLTVVQVRQETHDIKSIALKKKHREKFPEILAGQFLSFQIGDDRNA